VWTSSGTSSSIETAVHDQQLKILTLLLEATSRGLLKWEQSTEDNDHYFTTAGPVETYMQFKWVAFNGDHGSDRDFVEIGAAGHHFAGSPGWWLATEILVAANIDHWQSHNKAINAAYDQTIRTLEQALNEH
jgi:hypothetical protein